MKIALFGGSFDPFHEGHEHVLLSALKERHYNEILIIPNYQSPHKNKSKYSLEHRLETLEKKLPNLEKKIQQIQQNCNIKLSTLECHQPSYTISTLKHLTKANPKQSYDLLLGSDSFFSLHTWKSFNEILQLCHLCVVKRDQKTKKEYQFYAKEVLNIETSQWHCCKNELHSASSSLLKKQHTPFIIGICGRVGSGKSTALNILSQALDAKAIELDHLGHDTLINHQDLFISYFGTDILTDHKIDRKKLASIVFNNDKQRQLLNALSHPFIKKEALKKLDHQKTSLICGALLFEIGLHDHCHTLINIDANSQDIIKKIGKKFTNLSKFQLSKKQFIQKCPITLSNKFDYKFKKDLIELANQLKILVFNK